MVARFITVVGIVIRHVGNQRTPPEEDKQIELKQRLSRAKERHKSCARAWEPARFQFLLPTETPRTEPRTRKLIRDLLGVVTRHLSHPLCDCQVPVGTGTMRHQGQLSATASRVPQRIYKWSTGREWRRQNSMHQGTTFRIRAIREDETGKNGTTLYIIQYSSDDSDYLWQLISTLMPKAFENMDFSREHCFILFYPFILGEQM